MRKIAMAAVVVFVTACGGSDPLSAEEYFDAVEQLSFDYQNERDALREAYLDELNVEIAALQRGVDQADAAVMEALSVEALELTRSETAKLFASIGDALTRFDGGLGELSAPSDLEPSHTEMVRSVQLALDGIPGLIDAVGQAGDFDALDSAVAGSVFSDAQPRLERACLRLEEEATARDVRTDLRCGA